MKSADIFTFGKFKGRSLKWVMANHGSYIGWCLENIPTFKIEPIEMQDAFMKRYQQWKDNDCNGLVTHYQGTKPNKRIYSSSYQQAVKEMLYPLGSCFRKAQPLSWEDELAYADALGIDEL